MPYCCFRLGSSLTQPQYCASQAELAEVETVKTDEAGILLLAACEMVPFCKLYFLKKKRKI